MLEAVFLWVDVDDLVRAESVCVRWRQLLLLDTTPLWREAYFQAWRFQTPRIGEGGGAVEVDWRNIARERLQLHSSASPCARLCGLL